MVYCPFDHKASLKVFRIVTCDRACNIAQLVPLIVVFAFPFTPFPAVFPLCCFAVALTQGLFVCCTFSAAVPGSLPSCLLAALFYAELFLLQARPHSVF
jgi:hypothetical protein